MTIVVFPQGTWKRRHHGFVSRTVTLDFPVTNHPQVNDQFAREIIPIGLVFRSLNHYDFKDVCVVLWLAFGIARSMFGREHVKYIQIFIYWLCLATSINIGYTLK